MRVLDLSRLVAGNMLTQVLGDFGAEVIKVEPPAGDTLRAWQTNGVQTNWKIYARNKKSLGLELRKPEARELLREARALGGDVRRELPPRHAGEDGARAATRCSSSTRSSSSCASPAGARTGPTSRRPGFGTLVEGMSGFASFNGFADREPVLPPMYLADTVAGLYGAAAVMIALREVEMNGGRGQVIDLPLLDPLFAVLGPQAANYRLTGKVKPRTGSRSTNAGAAQRLPLQGRPLRVPVGLDAEDGRARCSARSAAPDLIDDPRYRTNAERVKHAEELDAIIGAFIAQRTQAENVAFFEQAEVTIGPIYDIRQILEDPHVLARELVADYPDPDMGAFPMHHVVPRLSGTPGSIRTPAPRLGEHNRALLAELGVDDAGYARLARRRRRVRRYAPATRRKRNETANCRSGARCCTCRSTSRNSSTRRTPAAPT